MIIIYILFALLLYLCYKSPIKAAMIMAICYPSFVLLPFPPLGFYNTVTILLFIFLAIKKNNINRKVGDKAIWFPLIICITSCVITFLTKEAFSLNNFLKLLSYYCIILILCFKFRPSKKNIQTFIVILIAYAVLLTLVGAFEAFSTTHPYVDYLTSLKVEIPEAVDNSFRTGYNRTQSLTIWCEAYGVILCMLATSFAILAYQKIININYKYIILLLLMLFGIISTNSRTMFVGFLISCGSFLPLFIKNTKAIFSVIIFVGISLYFFGNALDSIIGSIQNHEDSGGSTIEARIGQFEMTLFCISNSPLLGLGQSEAVRMIEFNKTNGLLGAESVIFITLLQRGFLGLFSIFLLWFNLGKIIYDKKKILYFMLFSFIFCKISTLCTTINEAYILAFLIPLYKMYQFKDKIRNESTLV